MPLPQNLANHKVIDTYYNALATYHSQDVAHEQATRLAFSTLLDTLSETVGWTLVLEQTLHNRKRPDGTLQDSFKLPRGYWEAKDTHDDLDTEIKAKIARDYPLTNIIFEDTRRAVLYQNNRPVFEADLTQRSQLVALLTQFFNYTGEQIEEFNAAVQKFKAECFEYRLGNRSALEWVIDQYQVSTDKRSGITSDPNRADDEEYIVRLVGRVVTVSVETVKLVKALPLILIEETVI
jgi:hypothetical protein